MKIAIGLMGLLSLGTAACSSTSFSGLPMTSDGGRAWFVRSDATKFFGMTVSAEESILFCDSKPQPYCATAASSKQEPIVRAAVDVDDEQPALPRRRAHAKAASPTPPREPATSTGPVDPPPQPKLIPPPPPPERAKANACRVMVQGRPVFVPIGGKPAVEIAGDACFVGDACDVAFAEGAVHGVCDIRTW